MLPPTPFAASMSDPVRSYVGENLHVEKAKFRHRLEPACERRQPY
jgi:hypothetical protein